MTLEMKLLDIRNEAWEEGIEKGRKEGIEEGAKNRTIEIARNMKLSGLDTNTIAKLTNLSRDEIDKL